MPLGRPITLDDAITKMQYFECVIPNISVEYLPLRHGFDSNRRFSNLDGTWQIHAEIADVWIAVVRYGTQVTRILIG